MRNINRGLHLVPFGLFCLFLLGLPVHLLATGPVFSQPGGPGSATINLTYGRSPLTRVTGTIQFYTCNPGFCSGEWAIVALDPYYVPRVPGDFSAVPMPAWISFNPTGSSPPTGGWTTVKMTIDPSKGTGGSILLGFIGRDPSVNGGAWHLLYLSTWTWYDQNGTQSSSVQTAFRGVRTTPAWIWDRRFHGRVAKECAGCP